MNRPASMIVVALAGLIALVAAPSEILAGRLAIGGDAPDFTLKNLAGEKVTLSEALENGPVLLDFWALWCKPCLKALPSTSALHDEFSEKGLTVLAINTDSPRSAAKVKPYIKTKHYSMEVLLDPNQKLQRLYRFNSIPQVYLIAQDGSIAYSQLGYSPALEERLESEVVKLFTTKSAPEEETHN